MLAGPTRKTEYPAITISATGTSATTGQRSCRCPTVVEIVGQTKSLPATAAQISGTAITTPIAAQTA